MEKIIEEIKEAVNQLTNHYSQRPPWWVTFLLTGMSSITTALIVYILAAK